MGMETSSGSQEIGGLTAFIDQGSSFEGKLSFKDTVRIDGHFAGEISSENTLVIGETGEIEADIRSETVLVSGSVAGDITATRQVVLHKTARIQGNVTAPSLTVEEGAIFNGQMSMLRSDQKKIGGASLKAVEGGGAPTPPGDAKAQGTS